MTAVKAIDDREVRGFSISALWPVRLLGRRPGLKEANIVCWGLLIAFLLVPSFVVFILQARRGSESIQRHSDFVLYYGDGTLANRYPAPKIYDPNLQHRVFLEICPHPRGAFGVSPYPPMVPYLFSLFARLPFTPAYFLWMLVSLSLYCAGIGFAAKAIFPVDRPMRALIFCFALAYFPFIGSTLVNGQLSIFAVFAVGLGLYYEQLGSLFYSGLALSLLTYKPTLLLLVLPMLVFTRRFRTLAGFCAGSALLVLVDTILGGIRVWPAYYQLLEYHKKLTGLHGHADIKLSMYLDFSSLTHLLPGGRTPAGLALAAGLSVVVGGALVLLLWKSAKASRSVQWLAWAATLTWTLLLNVYVPIYDSVLAVIAVILTLGALRQLKWRIASEWITLLAIITLAVSWKTVSFAKVHHVQLLSIALFLIAVAQLWFLRRAIQQGEVATPALES
ncbi:MAG TPA: glycosyltransferase family 87 protein [Acidobacteriaceae bacterium]|nr:glycosyltransferase family 87 protein [Acidobacteriaceae bacterium]